jgi:hypothetical protein
MMTVPQKKYFCKRIDEITERKVNDLKDTKGMTNKAIAQMGLAKGEVRYPQEIAKVWEAIDLILSDGKEGYGWGGSEHLGTIEISAMLKGFSDYKTKCQNEITAENNTICNQRNKLYEEATRIKDVAMFGSEEAAHAMLKEFVEWQIK